MPQLANFVRSIMTANLKTPRSLTKSPAKNPKFIKAPIPWPQFRPHSKHLHHNKSRTAATQAGFKVGLLEVVVVEEVLPLLVLLVGRRGGGGVVVLRQHVGVDLRLAVIVGVGRRVGGAAAGGGVGRQPVGAEPGGPRGGGGVVLRVVLHETPPRERGNRNSSDLAAPQAEEQKEEEEEEGS